tara:strand:- start:265 stop:429 length:165 start_codon:yes stop_codon:yes gene_type:complete
MVVERSLSGFASDWQFLLFQKFKGFFDIHFCIKSQLVYDFKLLVEASVPPVVIA